MRLIRILLLVTLAAAATAQAQTPPSSDSSPAPSADSTQSARQACRSDAMKVCPGKRGAEAKACLESNSDKISANCKDALAKLPAPAPKS
jgi:hypothetical protein